MPIDLVSERDRSSAGRVGEIGAAAGVKNRARGADHETGPVFRRAVANDCLDIAALRTDAGHEERHLANDRAHVLELAGIRRTDDEKAVAVRVPVARGRLRDVLVELFSAD